MTQINEIISLESLYGDFAVWDSTSLSFINTQKKLDNCIKSDTSLVTLMKTHPFISFWLGEGGLYTVNIRLNSPLTEKERSLVTIKYTDLKLEVKSNIIISSTEVLGTYVNQNEGNQYFYEIKNPEQGIYKTDLYFLYDSELMEKYELDRNIDPSMDRTNWVVSLEKVEIADGLVTPSDIYQMH